MHFYNPSFFIFSFDDGVDDSVQNNFQVMFGGFSLIFVYIAITLGRWNALEQRVRKKNKIECFNLSARDKLDKIDEIGQN